MISLTEEQLEIVKYNNNLSVNGVFGCGKTFTICEKIKYSLQHFPGNILALTQVGSVTEEITDRLFNFNMQRQGRSNHHIGTSNNKYVSVANFDSFVDKQCKLFHLKNDGNDFKNKINILTKYIKNNNIKKISLYNEEKISHLIIDEAQDLNCSQIKLIIELSKLDNLIISTFGDKLQSLTNSDDSISKWENSGNIKRFDLTLCFRCPKAHIDFINLITKNWRK